MYKPPQQLHKIILDQAPSELSYDLAAKARPIHMTMLHCYSHNWEKLIQV